MDPTSQKRELAGIAASLGVVIAFVLTGFLVMGSQFFGKPVAVPGDWGAAMLSLCSACVGYLIGKQSSNTGTGSVISALPADSQGPVTVQRTQDEKVTVTPTVVATTVAGTVNATLPPDETKT